MLNLTGMLHLAIFREESKQRDFLKISKENKRQIMTFYTL